MMNCDLLQLSIWWFMKISVRKWNFYGLKDFFTWVLISKISVKMNFRIMKKSNAADSRMGSPKKWILEAFGLTRPTDSLGVNKISLYFFIFGKRALLSKWPLIFAESWTFSVLCLSKNICNNSMYIFSLFLTELAARFRLVGICHYLSSTLIGMKFLYCALYLIIIYCISNLLYHCY